MTRIYTRTGDKGTTGLVGGERVRKDHQRIECFGAIDECSSVIGLARRALADAADERAKQLDAWLSWVQDRLFTVGSGLATLPEKRSESIPMISAADVSALEAAIDRAQQDLAPLTEFIHPGGLQSGAFLHLARAVCRRAERRIVRLAQDEPVDAEVIRFVNRLSDALFVWARWINHALGIPDHIWKKHSTPPL